MSCKSSVPVWTLWNDCERPTHKELPVWGSQAQRQMWAGHSACACKVHLLDQRDLLQCMKTSSHGLGSGWGVEGSGRRLHSFHSYVRLTRQTLAAVPAAAG